MPSITEKTKSRFDDSFSYVFPAIRGIQASKEYYVTMCPLKIIPRIFLYNESELPPRLRAQRVLNKARIPEITKYLTNNPQEYVFSSITVSVDGEIDFLPSGGDSSSRVGVLKLPMDARYIINDGQHRRAAIEEAVKENPKLGLETISVVLFVDEGLKRSQQLFADLNKHAVRPTKSLGILYDTRDAFSKATLDVIEQVSIFRDITELEKTNISNRSTKLFTLSSIYGANKVLLGKTTKKPSITDSEKEKMVDYWQEVTNNMPQWRELLEGKLSAYQLRQKYVNAHGVILDSLAVVGHQLLEQNPQDWKRFLKKLNGINWERKNAELWEGRALVGGNMSKSHGNIALTAIYIKSRLGMQLNSEEKRLELNLKKSKNR